MTLFEQYCSGGNPFEIQADHKDEETEDVLASNGVSDIFNILLETEVSFLFKCSEVSC